MLLMLTLCLGHHHHRLLAFGHQGDGSVSQDDVIRFVLSMQSKEGATSADRARMRHYQRLPSFTFSDGRDPNDINDDENIDKTLYNLGF